MNQLAIPTTYQRAMILGRTPRDAFAELKRRQRAGEVASAGPLQMITKGPHAGQYAIPAVIIVAPRDPVLSKRLVVVGSALVGISVFSFLLLWTLSTMSGGALFMLCATALAALWLRVRRFHGRSRVRVTTHVEVG